MKENVFSKFLSYLKKLFKKDKKIEIVEYSGETIEVIETDIVDSGKTEEIIVPIIIVPMEKTLKLTLERVYTCSTYTIGHLYADDNYVCDTLEDCDRGLNDGMNINEIEAKKKYGETAIPVGTYAIDMNTKSPKYSDFTRYSWAKKYNGYLPRLCNVKGYEGILMHVGNYPKDTLGCLLIGLNKSKGCLTESVNSFNKLMDNFLLPAKNDGYKISIEIKQKY